MRQMDHDAKEVMDLLSSIAPLPTMATVAADYRARQAASLAARAVPESPVTRVETFEVAGEGGLVRVRLYIDGDDQAPRPTLLFMHGGGFVTCSIDTHDGHCRRLAQETGLAVVSVDYRLAPEHPYPAAFEDCRDVLRWATADETAVRGIDGSRIAVAGDSAGGALAAALCLWARETGGPAIAHQVLIYPVIDNRFDTRSYDENATGYFLTAEAMKWFWRQYLGDEHGDADMFAAPGRAADLAGLPPATIVTADFDPLRDEGAAYAERLEAAGVPVEYRNFQAFHGFAGMEALVSARASHAFIVERLKAAMGR